MRGMPRFITVPLCTGCMSCEQVLAALLIACLTGCAGQEPSTDGLLALNRQLFETQTLE